MLQKLIEDVRVSDFKGVRNRRRELIVFGGPPCQGFSTSNQKTRTKGNPQNWLFTQYIRVVKLLQPEWIVFENVIGITQTANGQFLQLVRDALSDAGYPTIQTILNSVDFGVPQRRSRLFLVANRSGAKYMLPVPLTKSVTVYEAIGDLPELSNGTYPTLYPGPLCPSPLCTSPLSSSPPTPLHRRFHSTWSSPPGPNRKRPWRIPVPNRVRF